VNTRLENNVDNYSSRRHDDRTLGANPVDDLFSDDWDDSPWSAHYPTFEPQIEQLIKTANWLCEQFEKDARPDPYYWELVGRTIMWTAEAENRLYCNGIRALELGVPLYQDPMGDSDEFWVRRLARLCEQLIEAFTWYDIDEKHRPFLDMIKVVPTRAWKILPGSRY